MKIGLTTHHHSPGYGGPFTVISETANYLFKNNIDIRLIFGQDQNTKYNYNYKEIFKSVDLVHNFGIWTPFHIKIFFYAKKLNKKIIISTLGATEPWAMNHKKVKKKIAWNIYQKKILENCNFIHATSELEKKNLVDIGIKTPIKVIPHGVIIKQTPKLKINQLKKKALFFSRIHEKKGILELLISWSEINHPNWVLEIYGPASDQKYLNDIKFNIIKFSLQDKVKILDPVFDMKKKEEIFLSSDCFLLPSKSENFGMSIVEALAYGLPILTTEATPWSILKNNNGGKIIEFSQDNLTKGLRELLNMSDEGLLNMGSNGRNFIIQNFDINNVIHKYIDFYKEVLTS